MNFSTTYTVFMIHILLGGIIDYLVALQSTLYGGQPFEIDSCQPVCATRLELDGEQCFYWQNFTASITI